MDCYAGSTFLRDPNFRDLSKEVKITQQFLEYLRSKFPDQKIYYKFGNHEQRWQFYLWRKAEEISNLEDLKLENVLKLYKYQVEYISSEQIIHAGKLNIAHGHEIYSSAGAINVARNLRLKAFDNLIVGHFHRTQEDIATTISGKTVGVWTVGCLCGLRPTYRPVSFWNAGFALVEWDQNTFSVHNKKIILNRVL
jgi:UDP-2,3-diacylglucosamine pyrophosphatase LpxH